MKSSANPRPLIENKLLAALPPEDYQRLLPHLEFVSLARSQVIYDAGEPIDYIYFPTQAIISVVALMEDGAMIEVAVIGTEGMTGIPTCWGNNTSNQQVMVQIPGNGARISAQVLKTEFERGGALQNLVLHYTNALFSQAAQSAACNKLHKLEQRLARWLLTVDDRIELDALPLTQEFLSHMLGTRRSGVTEAANILSQAGIIHYIRGKITILCREKLESASCECYQAVKDEFARLVAPKHR